MLLERCPWYVAGPSLGLLLVLFRATLNRPFGALGGFVDLVENKSAWHRWGVSAFVLREPHVFLLMGSAVLVAAAGVRLLRLARLRSFVTREPIDWSPVPVQPRHIAGSALFGAGWSVACTCPGPVAAMIGQGHLTGLAVGAGLLAGIALKHRVEARSAAPQPGDTPHAAGL